MMQQANRKPIERCIVRETDKAILANICNGRGIERNIWLPKSQVEIDGDVIWVASWLLDKKAAEVGGIITVSRSALAHLNVSQEA